jgi:hemolysin III
MEKIWIKWHLKRWIFSGKKQKKYLGTINNMNLKQWLITHITLQVYDDRKAERLNALTHIPGIALGLILIPLFLIRDASPAATAGSVGFALSIIFLYTSSTMYHFTQGDVVKRIFRILDHTAIYVLIAGSYTPIIMMIPGSKGIMILAINWGLVAAGIFFTLFFWGRLKPLHVVIYIFMGWLMVFFWDDFIKELPDGFFPWLLAGGIVYTSGTLIYALKKIPYYHAWWHMVVFIGTATHAVGFYLYLR